jgi:hypothetical protein
MSADDEAEDGSERAVEAFSERRREGLGRIETLIEELRDAGRPGIPALMVAIHAIREETASWENGEGGGSAPPPRAATD